VCVVLINLGGEPFAIGRGDRIAQLVVAPVTRVRVQLTEELDGTSRGAGGFGHTGR
jgi:dUTP pyrophosphatase